MAAKEAPMKRMTWFTKAQVFSGALRTLMVSGVQWDMSTMRVIPARPTLTERLATEAAHCARRVKLAKRVGLR